jgi:hypothetical protein
MNVWLRERLGADGILVSDGHARHFFEQIPPDTVHLEVRSLEIRLTPPFKVIRPARYYGSIQGRRIVGLQP